MNSIISGGSPTTGPGALSQRLTALADQAAQAASDVAGNYLLEPSSTPAADLARGATQATNVRHGVSNLMQDIAIHGGDEGLTAAFRSISDLDDGLAALHGGVLVGDATAPGLATAILDEAAPKAAGELFKHAAESLRGVASLAHFEHLGGLESSVLDDAIRLGLRL
ncbi:MAG: hypothetical protein H7287_11655 [Thermoleophilia bacterium]|nr:hypothetical protein [Thermoleophilia bacterium]